MPIYFFDDKPDKELVGSKAYFLSCLRTHGFCVPNGFVVVGNFTEDELEKAIHKLHKIEEIKVAVRSSGIAEDGELDSFAGMFDSFLDVSCNYYSVLGAIEKCRGSINNERSSNYRQYKKDQSEASDQMPVIVQEMVENADISGVCFTKNPLNGTDEIIIEAVKGLGDSLVSGTSSPVLRFVFNKQRLAEGYENSLILRELENENLESKSQLVYNLACKALEIEQKFNGPQDIEFSITRTIGEINFLQARPITTIYLHNDLLCNQLTKEVFPNPLTQMNSSTFFEVIENGLQIRYEKRGINYRELKKSPERRFYEVRRGYLYQNVTVTDALNRAEFKMPYEETLSSFRDVPSELLAKHCNTDSIAAFNKLMGVVGLLKYLKNATPSIDVAHETLAKYRAKFSHITKFEKRNESLDTLLDEFESIQNEFSEFAYIYIDVQVYVELFSSIIQKIIATKCQSAVEKGFTYESLLVALGDVITFTMNMELKELIELGNSEDISSKFENQNYSNWEAVLENTRTKEALTTFLSKYGHRAVCELEVSSIRWIDDPSYIFNLIQISAANGAKQGGIDNLLEKRKEAERELFGACPMYLRSLFKWGVNNLQQLMRLRENLKDIVIRFIGRQQHSLLAISDILVVQNVLQSNSEIFYITIDNLRSFIKAKDCRTDLHTLSNKNLFIYEQFSRCKRPPKIFIANSPYTTEPPPAAASDTLSGISGAPGSVEGNVIFLRSLDDIHLLTEASKKYKNVILLTFATDPAWTPIFLHVSGIIVECGGILSHSAIVAREFGLPCVMGVNDVTSLLKTGDNVHLDGSTGKIHILK